MARDHRSKLPPSHKPRLKLFLSADIVGSTAYKQPLDLSKDVARDHTHWFHRVRSFYKTVVESYAHHSLLWEIAASELASEKRDFAGPRPRLWKTVGDEVIMWKEITDWVQLWPMLGAWLQTIDVIRTVLKANPVPGLGELDVKSTAWLAEFPVRNKVVLDTGSTLASTRRTYNGKLSAFYDWDTVKNRAPPKSLRGTTVDFIGSGIDVGFRIASFSTSSRMAISLDVAYLLAESQKLLEEKRHTTFRATLKSFFGDIGSGREGAWLIDRLTPFYDGREAIKGVLGGTHYPRFWIDTTPRGTLDEEIGNLEAFQHPISKVDWGALRSFCEKFYNDRRRFINKPFIEDDADFGQAPPRYYEFANEASLRVVEKSASSGS